MVATRQRPIKKKKATFKQKPILRHISQFFNTSQNPHRSFRLTRRRDYVRKFEIQGYWSFTAKVWHIIWRHKWLFTKFALVYSVFTGVLIGLMSQENYQQLSGVFGSLSQNASDVELGDFSINLVLFAGVLTGAFNGELSQAQQIYSGLLFLLGWLTIVWLLRQLLAVHTKVRLRDAVYTSASPLVPTFLLFMIVLIQTIPLIVAITAYIIAQSFNVFGVTLFSVMFWIIELLLAILSLYWLSASIIALAVVTLPGMYPIKALRIASQLVSARRLRILYRLSWLGFILILLWAVVLLPIIAVSRSFLPDWLPLVPLATLLLSSVSLIYGGAYVYLLYRSLVDDVTKKTA